jgi:sarcosine oxidase subunit gamma
MLELRGPNVREVLMKSTSYDVHPNNFPVGKAGHRCSPSRNW